MNHHTPATEKHVVVTNQLDTLTSFALEAETGEQVFISARMAKLFNIEVGDHLKVLVTPNNVPANTTQWYAVYLEKKKKSVHSPVQLDLDLDLEGKPETPRSKYESAILLHLKDGIDTAKRIGEAIGADTIVATRVLASMHKDGLIARAGVKKRPDQVKDSHVLWALHAPDFLPDED